MLLKALNRTLINEAHRPTYLTAVVAAAGTTLTVKAVDNAEWADNDYIIVGEIGAPSTELLQINGAVTDGTSLTIDNSGSGGARFAHSIGEPVYRIDFNQVEFSHNTTDSSSGVSVLTTSEVHPDDEFTYYQDTANTTGYGFLRFKNSTSVTFSAYSDGVNYAASGDASSYDPRTLGRITRRIRILLDEDTAVSKLTDDMVRDAVNDKQRDIAHQRLWGFYETEKSFSAIANQFSYAIPASIQKIYNLTFKTTPLMPINYQTWKQYNWNSDTTADTPSSMTIWDRKLLLFPRPSTAATTTTLGAAISTTTATTITVASSSSFKRGDYYRFIVDSEVIYATASTATTFTGALRGQEGTTAATHSNGATVTERDIVYTGHLEPTDLFDTQDRTSIPETDVIAYGAAIDLAPFVEKPELIDRFERKYTTKLKELEGKYAVKQSGRFARIKEKEEVIPNRLYDANNFPRDISGS